MKKLCIGTFLHILSKASFVKQELLFSIILKSIDPDAFLQYEDPTNQSHIKIGSNNLIREYISKCQTVDKDELKNYFVSKIIPELREDMHKNIVIAIKKVLEEDDVNPLKNIGFNEGYTKQDILNSNYFDFAELLTNVFYYCVTEVKNTPFKKNIAEMNLIELDQYDQESKSIHFNEKTKKVKSSIKSTVKQKLFEDTFKEVTNNKLNLPNNNELRTFHLDVTNNKFDYDRIKKLIRSNIGSYIFSRSRRNQYEIDQNIENITADAISSYKKKVPNTQQNKHFSEIMLYSFLEGVLDAPKIFSKIELVNINDDNNYHSISSGIHLLSMKKGLTPYNQLVFGTASTINSLEEAIDNAFAQINNIKNNNSKELHLVESTILNNAYDPELSKKLKDILLPKKDDDTNKPDTAFGIFLGYSIEISNIDELSNEEYRATLSNKMKADIDRITPYIINKINIFKLKSYSFYVYVLPLNNANADQETIMQAALEV